MNISVHYSHQGDHDEDHAHVDALRDVANHHGEANDDDGGCHEAVRTPLPNAAGGPAPLHREGCSGEGKPTEVQSVGQGVKCGQPEDFLSV